MALFRTRRAKAETVTLFFATDIHGSEVCWRKFVAAAGFYSADLLILGGDFTGKLLIPIVAREKGHLHAQFLGKNHEIAHDDLPAFERRVADAGFYPIVIGEEQLSAMQSTAALVDDAFKEQMTRRLVDWIQFARDSLGAQGTQVLTAPANDDPFFIDGVIEDHGGDVFVNVENQVVEIAPGHEMLSTGYTNRTPWNTPREYEEDEISAHIDQMAARVSRMDDAIFNIHPPPYGTKLDLAPKLNERFEVETSTGAPQMVHVGSKAVLDTVQRHQPMLSLHGHIHESAGRDRIGRTTAINPGSEYGEGILKGALVRIGEGRLHSYQATSG